MRLASFYALRFSALSILIVTSAVLTQPSDATLLHSEAAFRVGYAWKCNDEPLRLFRAFEFSNSKTVERERPKRNGSGDAHAL